MISVAFRKFRFPAALGRCPLDHQKSDICACVLTTEALVADKPEPPAAAMPAAPDMGGMY